MNGLYSLVPSQATSFDSLPAVTGPQLEQLRAEVVKARKADSGFLARAHAAASVLRGGGHLFWGFTSPWDALACVRYGADPRFPPCGTAVSVDVVYLDVEPVLEDARFVEPAAGSLETEVPRLAPQQRQRWGAHAIYKERQSIFSLAVPPEPGATARMEAEPLLQRSLRDAMRRAKTSTERRRIQALPHDLAAWNPHSLANWGDCYELYSSGIDLLAPGRQSGDRRSHRS